MTHHLDSSAQDRRQQLGFGLPEEPVLDHPAPDDRGPREVRLECQQDLPDHVYARHLIAGAPANVREHFARDLDLRGYTRKLAHAVSLHDLDDLDDHDDLDDLDGTDELDDLDELTDRRRHGIATETFVDLAESRGGARIDLRTGGRVPVRLARTYEVVARLASKLLVPLAAIILLLIAMGGTWSTASATPAAAWAAVRPAAAQALPPVMHASVTPPSSSRIDEPPAPRVKVGRKDLVGRLNLNTATEDQLMMLPTVGPSKAERIVTWRKKNGGFKRTADLRRVKGFGYKSFKKLEPFLDVKGDTTLAPK